MRAETKLFAISITILLNLILGAVSIYGLGDYGFLVFILIPFIIGFLPPWIYGRNNDLTRNECYGLSFSCLGLSIACLLIFALEGIICIAMASPIFLLLCLIGSYLAYFLMKKKRLRNHALPLLLMSSFFFMGFDYSCDALRLIPVTTQVEVNASQEEVWENIVAFNRIDTVEDWIFKTGVAFPIEATIQGEGVGAIRYCKFNTGDFVEPVTTWDAPNLLQFDVLEEPIPMNEWNPFHDIHPPHLDGYFQSKKGQFKLIRAGEDKTILEGTTFYTVNIHPQIYWSIWSDFIIHRVHKRVLNHIKKQSETTIKQQEI